MIKLRWDPKAGLIQIPLPTPAEVRGDPAYAAGMAALAAAVLESALNDLTDPDLPPLEREAARAFLMADPHGASDLDGLFGHWWGYFAPYRTLDRFRALVVWAVTHPRPRGGVGSTTWTMHAEIGRAAQSSRRRDKCQA
jgi:hypothetical protein